MTNESLNEWAVIHRRRVARLRRQERLPKRFVGRWVPVSEVLPPERFPVLISIACDHLQPAFAWLKYAADDIDSPFFVCPGFAGLIERGMAKGEPISEGSAALKLTVAERAVLSWFSPTAEPMVTFPIAAPTHGIALVGTAESGWCELVAEPPTEQQGIPATEEPTQPPGPEGETAKSRGEKV